MDVRHLKNPDRYEVSESYKRFWTASFVDGEWHILGSTLRRVKQSSALGKRIVKAIELQQKREAITRELFTSSSGFGRIR